MERAGNIHFLTHLYIFSRRESKTQISRQMTPKLRKRVTKQNKKNEEQTNEKQHFTPEDLFPFYYPSKTPEREYT